MKFTTQWVDQVESDHKVSGMPILGSGMHDIFYHEDSKEAIEEF